MSVKIFLAEDRDKYYENLLDSLRNRGYDVLLSARNIEQALQIINNSQFAEIEVAILDGNLDPISESGEDGRLMAQAIRQKHPNVKIICWSMGSYDWGDVCIKKSRSFNSIELQPLLEAIDG